MADAPPQLYGSAGYPVRKSGSQEVRGQGIRSQNFRGLDEKTLRDLGYSSQDARRGAIDLFNRGMRVNPDGTVQSSSIFSKKSYGNIADMMKEAAGENAAPTAPTAPSPTAASPVAPSPTARKSLTPSAPATTPRERFREKGTVASAAGVDLENLRDMATVKQPFSPAQPPQRPQIMPATARDAAAGRMDVMGPGGSPTSIASKYGTASVSSGPRVGKAMTRDTFAGRNVSLKDWLRQRRAAQMERGIA